MDDLLADFVAETREMLEASEGEIIAWEADPADRARLDTIFRFVHTVKGNCGFFDFPRLADLSHAAEGALADCRSGRREADKALVTAVLAIIDRIVVMVDAIEAGEDFPEDEDGPLIAALDDDADDCAPIPPSATPYPEQHEASRPEENSSEIAAPRNASPTVQRSIRLPVDLLDRVMSGVSDMVLARNDLGHRLREAGNQPTIDGPFERLTTILSDVRDAITRMRMQRIETLFASMPRLVRDLSAELGKQVMVNIEGGDVELDREVVEMVRDPLTHLIRNAIDHGIESPSARLQDGKREIGLLSLAARQSGNTISILVSDDGRGLDDKKIAAKALATQLISQTQADTMSREEVLQLIFSPGFSTAEEVSNVSGRGVGLDVVRANLEKVGGKIRVTSEPDIGTLFTLQIPLTLSIIAGLTVEVDDQRFAIPQSYVEEIIHESGKALDYSRVGEAALITFRGKRVPCLVLSDVLDITQDEKADADRTMVLLRLASGDLFALAVDRILSHGDLVIKPLAPAIMETGIYAGSTLLDDGEPILLLDVTSIAENHQLVSDARTRVSQSIEKPSTAQDRDVCRAMLFTSFADRRCAVRLELVRRIETITVDAIDRSGSTPRAVIENEILPLVGLPDGPLPSDKLRLLRLSDGETELLHAVREVKDAVELTEALKPVSDDPLIEAVTLLDDTTIALIDGHEIFARFGEAAETVARPVCRIPDDEWARTILAPLVISAGYQVVADEEDSAEGASAVVIISDRGDRTGQTSEFPAAAAVITLRNQPEASDDDGTIYRYDREGLIEALNTARKASGGR